MSRSAVFALITYLVAVSFSDDETESISLAESDSVLNEDLMGASNHNRISNVPPVPPTLDETMASAMTGENFLKHNASTPEEVRAKHIEEETDVQHAKGLTDRQHSRKTATLIVDAAKLWGEKTNMTQSENEIATPSPNKTLEGVTLPRADVPCVGIDCEAPDTIAQDKTDTTNQAPTAPTNASTAPTNASTAPIIQESPVVVAPPTTPPTNSPSSPTPGGKGRRYRTRGGKGRR